MSIAPSEVGTLGRLRVLVVDDDAAFLRLVERTILRHHPEARVHAHEDPATALAFYESSYPSIDVVLLDYLIGTRSGIELAIDMCAINPLEKILMMSAFSANVLVSEPGSDRVTYFMQKSMISPAESARDSVLDYFMRKAVIQKRRDLEGRMAVMRVGELEGLMALTAYVSEAEPVEPATAWLSEVLQAALRRLEPLLVSRRVRRIVDAMLVEVEGSEAVLVPVLFGLAARAVHAVPSGVRPVLDLRLHVEEERVRLQVRSNGAAVALDEDGFGLVRRALERMGGAAGVDASSGETCALWVELPRASV